MREIIFKVDGTVEENEVDIKTQRNLELEKYERILYITKRLDELSQDLIQVQCGAVFEDIVERKKEFRDLHNELRILEGKEVRVYQDEIKEIKAG